MNIEEREEKNMTGLKRHLQYKLSWLCQANRWESLLSKANEVLVVSVDVRQLNVNQQQNL